MKPVIQTIALLKEVIRMCAVRGTNPRDRPLFAELHQKLVEHNPQGAVDVEVFMAANGFELTLEEGDRCMSHIVDSGGVAPETSMHADSLMNATKGLIDRCKREGVDPKSLNSFNKLHDLLVGCYPTYAADLDEYAQLHDDCDNRGGACQGCRTK